MIHRRHAIALLVVLLVLLYSSLAKADAGLPMIALWVPSMVLLFIPIVGIEAAVLVRTLRMDWDRAINVSAIANALSSFIGVPFTWAVLVLVEFGSAKYLPLRPLFSSKLISARIASVIIMAPWIGGEGDTWALPAAMGVLFVPFFAASYASELLVVRRAASNADIATVRRAVLRGNLLSYALMLSLAGGLWLYNKICPK